MPVMDNGVLILSLSPKIVRSSRSCQDRFVMLFLQTFLNYQDFMYPNVSYCLSLLFKNTATFASLKLSLLSQRGNRSKTVPTERKWSGQNLQTCWNWILRQIKEYILGLSIYVPVSILPLWLTVSFCAPVMSFPTSFYHTLGSSP